MTENRKTPKLRFKGFTDAWEQRKVGDIAEFSKGVGYSKGDLRETGTPIILYGRLYTNYQFFLGEIYTFATPKDGSVYSKGNEVIIPASGETAEDIARASAVEKSGILLGGDLNVLRPFKFINPLFLSLTISNGEPHKNLAKRAQGKSVVHIHNSDIQDVSILFPSRLEQDRIVSVFRKLDNLITLHQRKLERLKNVKKSMLDKMFPKDGEVVPEIRFKGFTDAWEQRKLGDLAEIRRGLTYKPGDVKASGIRVLRSSNINEEYFEIYEDDVFVDEVAINIPYVKKGDIIITSANGSSRLVGKHAIIKNIQDNSMVHGGFMLVASADEPEFLNSSMSSPWYTKFINIYVAGGNGAIGNLSKNDLDNQEILVPSIAEQQKIGTYFRTIDNLITLHQRKLDKLKNIKKSMLDNMFV